MCVFLFTGCGSKKDSLKEFKDYLGSKDTYKLVGKMSLVSNEDEYLYDIEVGVSGNEFYKVNLLNTINDHEQVILKNDDGVFVVTPSLNKSFKFMSEWPKNSSQSYILECLLNDLNKDSDAKIESTKDGFKVSSLVNYPNNDNLVRQEIITDKEFNIKNVKVYDKDSNVIILVSVGDIAFSPKFDINYFEMNVTNNECSNDECNTETTANIIEDIIYPLYVPTDTYLSTKDNIATDNGNRVILTFAGVDPFILVEESVSVNKEMEVIPVNGEPIMIGGVIGAKENNSLYWTSNGIDYYLTSSTLDNKEMMTIAESTKNSSTLVASVK